jgi:hypothetical protein
LLFRLYGPEKPLFDHTWKLPDVEKDAAELGIVPTERFSASMMAHLLLATTAFAPLAVDLLG